MIDRDYFVRQATTLLRMARVVRDPAISAELLSKAADLDARADTAFAGSHEPNRGEDRDAKAN
jgi:hypothetical protein